ncbi:MAG: hypothetical protein ACM3JJ_09790, partial [Hyphomicrobiales bacterium]
MGSRATAARSLVAAALVAAALGASAARAAAPPDSTAAPALAPAAADWDTLSAGLPEQVVLTYGPRLAYDRVDGPFVGGDVGFKRQEDERPLMQVWLGYAFSRERGLGGADVEVPFGYRAVIHVGGHVYRRTASGDDWIVGGTENTFFALFARTDYRDWYEAEGGSAHATWDPGRDVSVRIGARVETQRSLRTRTRVAAFGKDDRFRPNPPIEDGVLGLWSASARIGPARIPPGGGTSGSLTLERAGDPVARDFRYTRLRAEARTTARLAPAHTVRARVIAGSTRDGVLPSQTVWHVGGIGTLRALDYKAFAGDQFFLANVEYYVLARKNLYPMAFVDWGAAWFGRDNLSRQKPGLDAGVGL